MTTSRLPSFPPQVVLLLAFGLTSLLNYGFGIGASRLLDPGDYGVVAFGQATLLLCGLVLQSGVPWSLANALVGAPAERRPALVAGAAFANVAIALALGLLIAGLFALGPLEAGYEHVGVLLLVVVALPFIAIAAVERATAQGSSSFTRLGVIQVAEVSTKTVAGLGLAAIGLGAAGALAGFAVGAAVASIIGLVLTIALVGRVAARARGTSVELPALRAIGPMFAALLGLAVLLNLDLIAVKLLVPDRAAAGQYQAAVILANAPYFLVTSAVVPVLYTRLAAHRSLAETRRRVADTLSIAVAMIVPLELLLLALPNEALAIAFPPEYASAAPILRLLAVGNIALILVAILGAAFQAVGRAIVVGRILLAAIALEAAALLVVVPRAAGLGAVLAFDVAAISAAVVIAVAYVREARVRLERPLAWAARFAVAGACGLGVALVVRNAGGFVPGAILGGALYYLLVARLRLVPPITQLRVQAEGR